MDRFLTYDAEGDTEVEVQSTTIPDNFHDCYVDGKGIVRLAANGAAMNRDNYVVVREK